MPVPRGALRAGLLFVAALTLLPAAAAQGFGRNKIQYDGFEWHVLRTEHFDVYYYPEAEDLARIGAATAEEAYDELEARFDLSLSERVPMVFYATNLHFKQTNITPGFIPDGVGGFFEFLKGRVVIPADGNLHRFRGVIRHELVHVFTFNKYARVMRDHRRPGDTFLPLWFTEGLAEHWSGRPDHSHEMILRDVVASNTFVPLHDLDRIAGTFVMYKQGEAFCRFVAETWGDERLLDLITESWRDTRFERVLETVLEVPFHELSDQWEAWVRAQYTPRLVGATVPSHVAPALAARGFNAKPVVHTRPDGSREVLYVSSRGTYAAVYAQAVDAGMRPVGGPEALVVGERSEDFEAFHFFESRMDVADDAGLLAFVTKRGAADVIHLYDLRARRRVAMLGFDGLVALYSPALSPDGQTVVFTGIDRGGIADLYAYDRRAAGADGLRRLTRDTYDDRDPDLAPDGRTVVFSSDRGPRGDDGVYSLFTLDLATGAVAHLTHGDGVDLSPRVSPDGRRVAFASARREADGVLSAQDLWTATLPDPEPPLARESEGAAPAGADTEPAAETAPARLPAELRRLTRLAAGAFDPVWADDHTLVFASLEDLRFTIRALDIDSLAAAPVAATADPLPAPTAPWVLPRFTGADSTGTPTAGLPYRRRYTLDAAQGGITTAATANFAAGGATIVFSDLLGDDRLFVSAFSSTTADGTRGLLESLNVTVVRLHLGRRTHLGYGAFRLAGPRFDRTDPEVPSAIPSFESVYGVIGAVSYPLSLFRRVGLETTLGAGTKEGLFRNVISGGGTEVDTLRTVQLANTLSFVHDNALYSSTGPVEGWRANAGLGYTTDLLFSNESFVSAGLDVRHYLRIAPGVTFASWGLVRSNVGRRARLNLIGGPWSLRGFPFLRVRGQNVWFTSHELRFPVAPRPPLFPVFSNLRGALFADAAHNWSGGYTERFEDPDFRDLVVGSTKGSVGAGARVTLLGALVLRYDIGWRFRDGLQWSEREPFSQFFFGWDF